MKRLYSMFLVGAVILAATACKTDKQQVSSQPSAQQPAVAAASEPATVTGTVVETMNAAGYTYVLVDDGAQKVWAAAPEFEVAVGDKAAVPQGMPMRDFTSQTLGKTFEVVYFVPAVQIMGRQAGSEAAVSGHAVREQVASAHGAAAMKPAETALDLTNIRKPDGGYTVAELFSKKADLAGKDVLVRGRIAKFTAAVMGKNWIHLQDGTGAAGSNDLTVSTGATAAVGDLVLVRGKLSADKDFGFGYRYDLIIEDATVTVE